MIKIYKLINRFFKLMRVSKGVEGKPKATIAILSSLFNALQGHSITLSPEKDRGDSETTYQKGNETTSSFKSISSLKGRGEVSYVRGV